MSLVLLEYFPDIMPQTAEESLVMCGVLAHEDSRFYKPPHGRQDTRVLYCNLRLWIGRRLVKLHEVLILFRQCLWRA